MQQMNYVIFMVSPKHFNSNRMGRPHIYLLIIDWKGHVELMARLVLVANLCVGEKRLSERL